MTFGSAIFGAVVVGARRGNDVVGGVRIAVEEGVPGCPDFGSERTAKLDFVILKAVF